MVGGTVGYNYQFNANWVLGIEADWDWASINGSATYVGGLTTAKAKDLGTARGRIGYAWSNWLLYATGGWAWTSKVTAFCSGCVAPFQTDSHSLNGYTFGGGVEYGLTPNISLKAEYLYANMRTTNFFVPAGCPGPCDIGANLNIFRVGANWRFTGL